MRTGVKNHQKNQQKFHLKNDAFAHWDDYGVKWAKNPHKGYDLLVPATNNPGSLTRWRCLP